MTASGLMLPPPAPDCPRTADFPQYALLKANMLDTAVRPFIRQSRSYSDVDEFRSAPVVCLNDAVHPVAGGREKDRRGTERFLPTARFRELDGVLVTAFDRKIDDFVP